MNLTALPHGTIPEPDSVRNCSRKKGNAAVSGVIHGNDSFVILAFFYVNFFKLSCPCNHPWGIKPADKLPLFYPISGLYRHSQLLLRNQQKGSAAIHQEMSAERNDTEVRHLELSMESSEEGSSSSISSYFPFIFLITSVIGLLQAADQFETHPAIMWISVAALLIFCLLLATKKKSNRTEHGTKYSQIIDSFRVFSGALVAVSLLSIHLPHRLRWLFFLIWALLAACIAARHFFNFKDTWIYTLVLSAGVLMKKAILSAWNNISNRFTDPITV